MPDLSPITWEWTGVQQGCCALRVAVTEAEPICFSKETFWGITCRQKSRGERQGCGCTRSFMPDLCSSSSCCLGHSPTRCIQGMHTLSPSLKPLFKWQRLSGWDLIWPPYAKLQSPIPGASLSGLGQSPRWGEWGTCGVDFKEALTLKVLQMQSWYLLNLKRACLFKCGP